MKLAKPITLQPPKYTDPASNTLMSPPPITTDYLEIAYIDNDATKEYLMTIKYIPKSILIFNSEEYHDNITKDIARAKFLQIAGDDIQLFLQKQYPKTLEEEPYGPGSILHSMFSSLGIKAGPNCSCKRHALKMNEEGIEWCEENLETILGWLQEETKKRNIPFVKSAASLIVKRAINKARKFRDMQNA